MAAALSTAFAPPGACALDYVPGTVLVRWKPASKLAARTEAMAPLGATVMTRFELNGVEQLSVPGMSVSEAVARLAGDPRVEYAEPDYLWHIERAPDDPRYPEQYGLRNRGQTGGLVGADINAEPVWDRFTGDPELLIADLDTGAEYDHPDLEANIWTNPGEIPGNGLDDDQNGYIDDVHGYDFANHDGDPRDDNGHGTHTAGTIAAVGNNGVGVSGVVWRGKLVVLKFLSASGSGPTSGAVEALQYAVRMGVRVSNNSWNGGFYSRALEDAIIAAGDAGHLFVAAAGNSRTNNDITPSYPAALPEDCVLTVAATDHADQLAGFTNYGATTVDLAAPGVDILSTVPGATYRLLSGTSMAAPHVTGAAALLMGRFPGMSASEVKSRLMRFVDVRPGLSGRCVSGGRLNVALAASDPDSIVAGDVTDLRVLSPGSNSVELAWTATGDDGAVGTASSYELRYSATAFTAAEFARATAGNAPRPQASGAAESYRLRGLAAGGTYWLALRARDEFGNAGAVSNVVTFTTQPSPEIAFVPGTVGASASTGNQVTRTFEIVNDSPGTLEWSAPRPVLEFAPAAQASQSGPGAPAAKGDPDPAPAEPQLANAGGPDSLGYRWVDSREPQGPVFQWVDIAQPANQIALTNDEAVSAALPLGFSFPIYGRRFTQVKVCTNGYLQFGNEPPA
ncbi:MAG: S8 family serine peptidase, partial [Candidatus Eisenbacteria bacterium]